MTIDSAYFFETHEVSTVDPVYFFGHENIGITTIVPWVTYTDENGVFVSRGVQTTEYTITLGGENPIYWRGRVNILDPDLTLPGDDTTLYFFRKTTIDQQYGFGDTTKFPSERVEFGVDKLTLILQEIEGNKCGCDGGGVNEAPDPGGNTWPGTTPPVAGPGPNPYSFPQSCCTYFRDAYRFQAGDNLVGDYNFTALLDLIAEGEDNRTLNVNDVDHPFDVPGDAGGLRIVNRNAGQLLGNVAKNIALAPCGDFSTVGLGEPDDNQVGQTLSGATVPHSGALGTLLIPSSGTAEASVPYLNFEYAIANPVSDRMFGFIEGTGTANTFRIGVTIGANTTFSNTFELRESAAGPLFPVFVYTSWSASTTAGGGWTMTVQVPEFGVSHTQVEPSYPRQNLAPANDPSNFMYVGGQAISGQHKFFHSILTSEVLTATQLTAQLEAAQFECKLDPTEAPEPCVSAVITQLTPPSSFEVESFPFLLNMSVTATGTAPLEYRWKFNGSFINGETSSTFSKTLNDENDVGNYSAWVSNECTQVPAENGINITYNPAPVCTPVTLTPLDPPTYAATGIGDSVEWFAEAAGTPPFTYEWFKDSVSIPGATTAFYTAVYNSANDLGTYECLVTNACGVDSSSADLTTACVPVDLDPLNPATVNILGYPQDISWTATLTAGSLPVTYQWRFFPEGGGGFEDIPGETSATFTKTVTDASGLGSYAVVATNACGSDSESAGVFTGPT